MNPHFSQNGFPLIPSHEKNRRHATERSRGFSLVELLTVIAIISMLASFSALSLRGMSGASSLSTGGAKVTNLLESARNLAILKKTPVAVVLLTGKDNSGSRVFTALEYSQDSGQWVRASKWESLPAGILVDTSSTANNLFLPSNSPTASTPLPNLTYGGESYAPQSSTGYGYAIFLPNGSLYQTTTQPCILRLAAGFVNADSIKYTGGNSGVEGQPADYFEVVINESTGRVKNVRPE